MPTYISTCRTAFLLYSQHNSTKVIAVKMYSKRKNQDKNLFLILLVMINVGYNLSVTNA